MKNLDLRDSANREHLALFQKHLEILGYSKETVSTSLNNCKELLSYLEKDRRSIAQTSNLLPYFEYLQTRSNQKFQGGLSVATLHKQRTSIKLFYEFLASTQGIACPQLPTLQKTKSTPCVLSVKEVEQLFKACGNSFLGKRNKAVLALYYGLGLRRKEGVQLKVEDLNFDKDEVLITQSKTHRQRVVPMSDHVKQIIEDYVFNVREKLIPQDRSTDALLVTERGTPLSVQTVYYIVKSLGTEAKIKTSFGVHTLRHSIATHLLQAGMSLENIALFLGHTSLDSTQIYTHLQTRNAQ